MKTENNQPVDKSRRKAIGAGIVAPVIMTLASKPVFAFQSLSAMLSGNTSHAVDNGRLGGMSPGFWKDINGSTDYYNESNAAAWTLMENSVYKVSYGDACVASSGSIVLASANDITATDFVPSDIVLAAAPVGKGNNKLTSDACPNGFTGGTTFSSVFGGTDSRSFREVLNEDNGTPNWHLTAGYLNAVYFELKETPTKYMFTVAQFLALYSTNQAFLLDHLNNCYYHKTVSNC
jgi:hypothetical protein